MARPRAVLEKDLSESIERGHPWLYDRALQRAPRGDSGALVDVEFRGRALACGYLDPASPIRVRLLGPVDGAFDGPWVRSRAADCARVRAGDPTLAGVEGRRLIHGENDGMPGLVVDSYRDTAVVVTDGPGPTAFWRSRMDAVLDGLGDGGYPMVAAWHRPRGQAPLALRGAKPPHELIIAEDDIRFAVDVVRGQKTGLFLDQRDNRRRAATLAPGMRVLNLFSYNAGFSLAAALAGAEMTTSVDVAAPAIESARRCFELSGIPVASHELVVADVFDFAEAAIAGGRRWDIVICDPPSFAPNAKSRGRALAAYRRLAAACLELVELGGTVLFASCSSHVDDKDLLGVLAGASAAADPQRMLRVQGVFGAASDHPIRPGFPEGRYLDAIFANVS